MMIKPKCNRPNSEFSKKHFFEQYMAKIKELGKRQREYKKILSTTTMTRKETIIDTSFQKSIETLKAEKNDLRAQIWVATGQIHKEASKRFLANIRCHVQCQEHLADDVRKLKEDINNLEREISRVNKEIYELNRRTVPDSQHQEFVATTRKKMNILENQYEVGVRQECGFAAANAKLREEVIRALNNRTFFNESYMKLVQNLNSDRKYLIDLIEYAQATFDNCIELYEKIDNLMRKERKDRDYHKIELQGMMRVMAADTDNFEFLDIKAKQRNLADLLPKEYKRRDQFRRRHIRKINLYSDVLSKIFQYTDSTNVDSVIVKFQEQESLYYSYFNYANEMSYHMTLLNNSVNRLFNDINSLKLGNLNTLSEQLETIETLTNTLTEKREKNRALQKARENHDNRLENLLQGFHSIIEVVNADTSHLMLLLGDNTKINLVNVRTFLKILEDRIIDITATVYVMERQSESKPFAPYIIPHIEKMYEIPTPLSEIVLTQQCPECAEGEAFNMDEECEGVTIDSKEKVKKKLYEKVNQPEMQYRLHSISQCRLPRSRVLAAKRNG